MAQPKLGSGERFRKLSGTLAARGAKDPDALAAWIGRRKYGAKKFGGLSSHSHASPYLRALLMAEPYRREPGETQECAACGKYNAPDARYCDQCGALLASGDDDPDQGGPDALRTPAPGNLAGAAGFSPQQIGVRAGNSGGLSTSSASQRAMEFAGNLPVISPWDILVSRSPSGTAVVRHRRGGADIGEIKHTDDGWVPVLGGKDLSPHVHQRAALAELIGTYSKGARPAAPALQPPPVQTPLMSQFGIPAVRALARPATARQTDPG